MNILQGQIDQLKDNVSLLDKQLKDKDITIMQKDEHIVG